MLVRLVYYSKLSSNCSRQELENILETSRKNNPDLGLTGILCYDPVYFLQWIEGPISAVNALYAKIIQDSRHEKSIIAEYSEISARSFENWSMAYVATFEVNKEILYKYSPTMEFNPYIMNAESIRYFLLDMARERKEFLMEAISLQEAKQKE